jgi:hypothetical protein
MLGKSLWIDSCVVAVNVQKFVGNVMRCDNSLIASFPFPISDSCLAKRSADAWSCSYTRMLVFKGKFWTCRHKADEQSTPLVMSHRNRRWTIWNTPTGGKGLRAAYCTQYVCWNAVSDCRGTGNGLESCNPPPAHPSDNRLRGGWLLSW